MYNSVVKQLLISIKPFPARMKLFLAVVVATLHPLPYRHVLSRQRYTSQN